MRLWFNKSVRYTGFKFKKDAMVIKMTTDHLNSPMYVKLNNGGKIQDSLGIDWDETCKQHWTREDDFFEMKSKLERMERVLKFCRVFHIDNKLTKYLNKVLQL